MPDQPRDIGSVKWYGGQRRDGRINRFGIITPMIAGSPELFIHEKDLACPPTAMREGVAVTFTTHRTEKGFAARNLRLLVDEKDPDVLRRASEAQQPDIRASALVVWARTAPSEDLATRVASERAMPRAALKQIFIQRPELLADPAASMAVDDMAALDVLANVPPDAAAAFVERRYGPDNGKENYLLSALVQRLPLETQARLSNFFAPVLSWDALALRIPSMTPDEIASALRGRYVGSEQLRDVPDEVIASDSGLFARLDIERQATVLQALANRKDERLSALTAVFARHFADSRTSSSVALARIPEELRANDTFMALLPPALQLEARWPELTAQPQGTWPGLGWQQKILATYRRMAGDDPPFDLGEEPDPLPKVAVRLHSARDEDIFEEVHELIVSYVLQHGWRDTDVLDLTPLLPACLHYAKPTHLCEGKPSTKEEPAAFCPRLSGPCDLRTEQANGYARIAADTNRDIEDWSLLELLELTASQPRLPELADPRQYVNRLSGWVNRYNEIRPHLACRTCGSVMVGNLAFSRKLTAKYSTTIVRCPADASHDGGDIYLNHCRGCGRIIDSRDSSIQDSRGYYLCIKCGSGSEDTVPGQRCPACGRQGTMRQDGRSPDFTCGRCHHSITIPWEDWRKAQDRRTRHRESTWQTNVGGHVPPTSDIPPPEEPPAWDTY